jgi:membrane protease YdiL (CAAX protease family)
MSNKRPYGSRLPSWVSLLLLLLAIALSLLLWGACVLAVYRIPFATALRFEALGQNVRDAYSIGMYVLLVVFLALYWRSWEGRRWRELGMSFSRRELGFGLAVGGLSLITTYGCFMALGWAHFVPPSAWPVHAIASSLLAGSVIGTLEEGVFRGVLLRTLLRDTPPPLAIGGSAVLYALSHFLRPGADIWSSLPIFLGLWLTGVLLAYAAWSRQNLWSAIAIHGIWIGFITLWGYADQAVRWTGGGYPISGVLTMLVMVMCLGLLALLHSRERMRSSLLGSTE